MIAKKNHWLEPENSRRAIVYPDVRRALESMWSRIEPDGSVELYLYDSGENKYRPFRVPAYLPENTNQMADQVWADRLLHSAKRLTQLFTELGIRQSTGRSEEEVEECLRRGARFLSMYRNDKEFIDKAVSLVKIDTKRGIILEPRLPTLPGARSFHLFRFKNIRVNE